ncbi:MAG: C45 family autoproteolytic acyltransferase/hydrolase [Elsteraceae bacterium]
MRLSGSPRERGRQYGAAAAGRILTGAAHYHAQLRRLGYGEAAVNALVESLMPKIAAFDASYVEEMRGIAEGADTPLSTVALINARTEVLALAKHESQRRSQPVDTDPDGCTSVVVQPGRALNGVQIHAQNWDWKVECAETGVVLNVRSDHGPSYLTFTEAGGLARSGFNSAGVSVTANYLESDRDYRDLGVPLALIRRKILESGHFAEAIRAVRGTRKSASNNIMIAHHAGLAFSIECAPDETFVVKPEDDLLVHANHWVSPVALCKLVDTGVATVPDSLYRDMRVRSLLDRQEANLSVADVKAALFDDLATPWSVCRPPRLSHSDNLTATVAMIVMQPALGLLEIAPLPALNKDFTTYRLIESSSMRKAS